MLPDLVTQSINELSHLKKQMEWVSKDRPKKAKRGSPGVPLSYYT